MEELSVPLMSSLYQTRHLSWGKFCVCPNTLEASPGSDRGHKLSDLCHLLVLSVEKALAPGTLAPSQLT